MNLNTVLTGLSSYLTQRSNPKAMGLFWCIVVRLEIDSQLSMVQSIISIGYYLNQSYLLHFTAYFHALLSHALQFHHIEIKIA